MGMTNSDANAYAILGTVGSNLDDAKAAFSEAQASVDAATSTRDDKKAELDAAFAAYITSLRTFDGLLSTPPVGYVATPPQP